VSVDEVRPRAIEALGEVFGLSFEELPAEHQPQQLLAR
jgi:hypothetical protein